ncbi:unnamed protein product [Dicrocoelium dendriticum]|nr:unnamed protein product [Dicrocoelium dendriticum]
MTPLVSSRFFVLATGLCVYRLTVYILKGNCVMSPSMPFLFACLKLLGRKVTNAPPLAGSYLSLFSSYRRPSNFQRAGDSSSDSDSDDSDAEDHSFANDSDDPYHSEDVAFNPNFRQLSCTVRSLRYDKILRIGLNLTRSAAESAFLSSRLRLNGVKLLKKGVRVDEGDNLDFVVDFEDQHSYGKRVRICFQKLNNTFFGPSRLRVFLTRRPPLALCALVLTLSFLSLIGLDAAVHLLELRDPDVETHWNRLLLELSNLEFCFSNSTNAKTLADSFSAAEMLPKQLTSNVDHIVHYVHLHVLLYPTMVYDPGETYVATASMRGRHIAIKGAPALHPLNVTFEIRPGRPLLDGQLRDPNPIRLSSCVKLSSSQQILPRRTVIYICSRDLFYVIEA